MGRQVRDTRLESREARQRLSKRHRPYWRVLAEGVHLGYRKGERDGVWRVRAYVRGKYQERIIGPADDFQDAENSDAVAFGDAQRRALAIADEWLRGGSTARNPTVAHAAQRYLEWFKDHRKAYRPTELAVNVHILPEFGQRLLRDLTTPEIRAWHHKLAAQPARERTGKGSKQQFRAKAHDNDSKRARKATANRILTTFRAILNKAYQDELISTSDPWKRVKPFENVESPRVRFLQPDEAKRLVNACPPDFRQMVQAALLTGARYSELAGLKVSDVDLVASGMIYIAPSKGGKARHIPLNDEGRALFKAATVGKKRDELVFAREDKEPWGHSHQIRLIGEASSKAKISPAFRFHELRHSYASMLAQRGVDLLTLSKLLGHADTRMTSKHYAHLCDRTLSDAVAKLPGFGKVPKQKATGIFDKPQSRRG